MAGTRLGAVPKRAFAKFFADDATTLGASVAFYAAMSIAPMVVLFLWLASFLGPHAQDVMLRQVTLVAGPNAAEGVGLLMQNSRESPNAGTVAGLISLVVLVVSASTVFVRVQDSLNRIWGVPSKHGRGLPGFLRKRAVGMVVLLVLLMTLATSVAAGAALMALAASGQDLPAGPWFWEAVNIVLTLAVLTGLLAVLFKYVPAVKVTWPDVWAGAATTALLLILAKFGLDVYLGHGGVSSAYGAAGSLIAFLLWVYCSALVLFLGAELTQAWAGAHGRRIGPDDRQPGAIEPPAAGRTAEHDTRTERERRPPPSEPSRPRTEHRR